MTAKFSDYFAAAGTAAASAPGRVNLMGEHTDYNGGFVLPTAIPQRTSVELAPRPDDPGVRLASFVEGSRSAWWCEYRLGEERAQHDWRDYVMGVTQILRSDGHEIGGFHAVMHSDVPLGSGLASSASMLVALIRTLRQAFSLAIDDVGVAKLARRVENEFVGAQIGIMDTMAASLADDDSALFLDTRALSWRKIPLPRTQLALAILDSGVSHSHIRGGYNTRRAECQEAARMLGVMQLSDLGLEDLPRLAKLPELLRRRARHVITENARVLAMVGALEACDMPALGALFDASHASMRDDFDVSVTEVDLLVELMKSSVGVYGARLTGGGFGGSIVALCSPESAETAALLAAQNYRSRIGRRAIVVLPRRTAQLPFSATRTMYTGLEGMATHL